MKNIFTAVRSIAVLLAGALVSAAAYAAVPSLSVSRTPNPMIAGANYTVSWNSSNATNVSYNCSSPSGGFSGTGSVTVGSSSSSGVASAAWVGRPSTCVWTATGPGGPAATVTEYLTTQQPVPPPTISVSRSPSPMVAGAGYTVYWYTSNATTLFYDCRSSTGGFTGSGYVTPSTSNSSGVASSAWINNASTCTWTASNSSGSAVATEQLQTVPPAPTVTITRNPTQMTSGQPYTVTWDTTDATSLYYNCTSSNGGYTGSGYVSPVGHGATLPDLASAAWVGKTSSCAWTASGAGGSKTVYETLTTLAGPTISVTRSPTPMVAGFEQTVTWNTTNATAVSYNCTSSSGGYAASGSFTNVNGSATSFALPEWIGKQSTCVWTASAGAISSSATETLNTVAGPATLKVTRDPNPMVANKLYTVTWQTVNANSVKYDCTSSSGGFTGSDTLSSVSGTTAQSPASAAWVNKPSSCTWTALGSLGNATVTETVVTLPGAGSPPTALLTASPANVRVSAGGSAQINLTASGADSDGQVVKLELFKDSGSGFGTTPIQSAAESSASWSTNFSQTLAAGIYRFYLRSTDSQGNVTESAMVPVNVTDSSLLGTVSGVRSDASGTPQLYGWVCQDNATQALNYQVFVNAPGNLGGTQIATGVANLTTETDNATVQSLCHTTGYGHHFNVNLASFTSQYPGAPIFVQAQAYSGGATVVLPCGDNNCTMPGSLRIGLTTPANNDRYTAPATVFMRAQISGGTGPYDEVAFSIDGGAWIAGTSDTAANTYYASSTPLATRASPYIVMAKVRKGNSTLYSVQNLIYVDAASTSAIVLGSPSNGASVTAGSNVSLAATPGGTGTAASVKFYANGALIATGVNGAGTWTAQWANVQAGTYAVTARSFNSGGTQLAQSAAANVIVSATGGNGPNDPIPVAVTPPYLGNPDAGSLPGSLNVGNNGAATYNIPIAVPPGTAGLAPTVSLDYSSLSPNGIAGYGWNLSGMSSIRRCVKTLAQDGQAGPVNIDVNDALCLDGQRLLLASGTYGQVGATYRTEIDNFSRITAIAGINSQPAFKVETKGGQTLYYGNTTDSAVKVIGKLNAFKAPVTITAPLYWDLAQIQDRAGNRVNFEYTQDTTTGEQLLNRIRYGNMNTLFNSVEFGYECRNSGGAANCIGGTGGDADVGYVAGARADSRHRLKTITTKADIQSDGNGGNVAQVTTLTYATSAVSQRSLLKQIQVCPGDGGNCLPATNFNWGTASGNNTFADNGVLANGPQMGTYSVRPPPGVTVPLFNEGTDWQQKVSELITGDFVGDGKQRILIADYDGWHISTVNAGATGFDVVDLLYANNAQLPKIYKGRANTQGYGSDPPGYQTNPPTGPYYGSILTGDFDGDGRTDIAFVDTAMAWHAGTNMWNVCLSRPTTSVKFECRTFPLTPAQVNAKFRSDLTMSLDVNADGRADVVYWGSYIDANGNTVTSMEDQSCRFVPPSNPSTNDWSWNCAAYPGVFNSVINNPLPLFAKGSFWAQFNNFSANVNASRTVIGDFQGTGQNSFIAQRNNYASASTLAGATSDLFSAVPTNSNFNTRPIGTTANASNNQFVWSNSGNGAKAMARYFVRQSSMVEVGGTSLGDLNGDGYTDYLMAFEGHTEICYSVGMDGFDCRLMIDETPSGWTDPSIGHENNPSSPPSIPPDANGLYSVYSVLSTGHVRDNNLTEVVYRRGKNAYSVCTIYDGKRNCSDWSGPTIEETGHVISQYTQPGTTAIFTKVFYPATGSVVGDYTGKGRVEILYYGGGNNWHLFTPNSSGPVDRLTGVTNGIGNQSTVDYLPMSDSRVYTQQPSDGTVLSYPLRSVPGDGRQLVSQLHVDKGDGTLMTSTYQYEGSAVDLTGRGDQGFERVTITNPHGTQQTTQYAQGFPYAGMPVERKTISQGGTVLDQTSFTNAVKGVSVIGKTVLYPYMRISAQLKHKDLDGSELPLTTETVVSMDDWGNPLNTTSITQGVSGDSNGQTYTTITTNIVDNFPTNPKYRIGEIRSNILTKQVTGQPDITRTKTFEYAGSADDSMEGLLKKEIVEPTNPLYTVTTIYGRDTFGNIRQTSQSWQDPATSQSLTRITSDITFEPQGRFPQLVKNATCFTGSVCQSETRGYDDKTGAQTSLTGPNGLPTTWQVDGFGRRKIETHADNTESRSYFKQCLGACPLGAATVAINDRMYFGNRTDVPTLTYSDAAGHVLRTQTWGFAGDVIVTDRRYNEFGLLFQTDQPRFINDSAVLDTQQYYDELNRVNVVSSLDEQGALQTTNTYYQGLVTDVVNPKLLHKINQVNPVGQLVKTTEPIAGITSFTRDAFGNLVKTTDSAGNVVTVTYDLLGRKTALRDPDLGWIQYDIDPRGMMWRQTKPNERAKSTNTIFQYDMLDRMIARLEFDLKSYWVYDQAAGASSCAVTKSCGQLVEAYTQLASGKDYDRLQSYNSFGYPSTTVTQIDLVNYTSTTQYDAWGRVMGTSEQRGSDPAKSFGYRYNNYGYKSQIQRGGLALWQATTKDAANRLTQATLGNGLRVDRNYYPQTGRLSQATLTNVQSNTQQVTEGYFYDKLGNVSTRTQYWGGSVGFSEVFGYDDLNRLSNSTIGAVQNIFTYDGVGNISSKTGQGIYTYPTPGAAAVQPHAVSSIANLGSFHYDADGNMLDGAGRSYIWTIFDMPFSITKGGQSSQFTYGAEHQRTRQTKTGSVIRYAGAMEVETNTGNGGTTVKTYWPMGLGVEIDRPGATTSELNWTHTDRLGSVIAISNQSGNIVEKLEYDAWGKRRSVTDLSTPDALDGQIDNKGFTGHEMLDQLDLVHMNGRVYDPLAARFVSADPYVQEPSFSQSYNRYSYVWNNPTNLTDPTGFLGSCNVGAGDPCQLPAPKVTKCNGEPNCIDVPGKRPTKLVKITLATMAPIIRYASRHPDMAKSVMTRLVLGGAAEAGPLPVKVIGSVILGELVYEAWKANKADDAAEKDADKNAVEGTDKADEKKTSRRPSKGVRDEADKAATDANGNLICTWCGVDMTPEAGHDNSREHDHIDPWRDTKDSSSGNITDACRTCNRSKGTKSPEDFLGIRK